MCLQRMSTQSSHNLNCFVSMPFGALFDRYYQNIFVPAIQAAGVRAIRADSIFSSTSIMSDIWRYVRNASVVLADLTGKNSNVFYELGLRGIVCTYADTNSAGGGIQIPLP